MRDPAAYKHGDETLGAWQVLKIAEEVYNLRGNVTIAGLAALAGGGRQTKIKVKQRRGAATEMQIDINKVAGGKVQLTVAVSSAFAQFSPLINQFLGIEKETEMLIVQLLVEGYLTAQVQRTQYATYAYLIPSLTASRITRHTRGGIPKCDYTISCHFPIRARKGMNGKKRAESVDKEPPPQGIATTSGARPSHPTKRKHEGTEDPEDDGNVIEISSDAVYEDDEVLEADPPPRSWGTHKPFRGSGTGEGGSRPNAMQVDSDSEGEWNDDGWTYSHRQKPRQRRRTKSPATMADLSDF